MKVAILIDGGYLLKRLGSYLAPEEAKDVPAVCGFIDQLVADHLGSLNDVAQASHPGSLLYRCFYYDAQPYLQKAHYPISKRGIDYSKTPEAKFRLGLFDALRRRPNFAVRLGEVRRERNWVLRESAQDELLKGKRALDALVDEDFEPGFRQKAVDMRIGLDIASIILKRQADTIVLVAGDSDFVPAAKLARREGGKFILDPLGRTVDPSLFEHIDELRSVTPHRPKAPPHTLPVAATEIAPAPADQLEE